MVRWFSSVAWKRLLRFRLRSLLVAVAFAAVLLSWWSDRRRLEERIGQRDDLLVVLRSAPHHALIGSSESEGWSLFDLLDLQFGSVDDFLHSIRDGADWTKLRNGEFPSLSFKSETLKQTAAPRVIPLLKDADPNVRERAAHAMRHLGELNPGVAPDLFAAIGDECPRVRCEAGRALCKIDKELGGVGPILVPYLDGDQPEALDAIITAIRKHDSTYDLNPRLLQLLTHSNAKTRATAAASLTIGHESREVVTRLLAMLTDPDAECRMATASTLSDADPSDDLLYRMTLAFKKEADDKVRCSIAHSVERIHRKKTE